MRCGLVHGTGEDSKIIWNNRIPLALDKDGNLNLSPSFIWGLALCVIVCNINCNEKIGETCWISTASFKYLINDLWGKRGSVKMMIRSQYNVIIEENPLSWYTTCRLPANHWYCLLFPSPIIMGNAAMIALKNAQTAFRGKPNVWVLKRSRTL